MLRAALPLCTCPCRWRYLALVAMEERHWLDIAVPCKSISGIFAAEVDGNDVIMAFCPLQWMICRVCSLCRKFYAASPLPCLGLSYPGTAWQPNCTQVSIVLKLILMLNIAWCWLAVTDQERSLGCRELLQKQPCYSSIFGPFWLTTWQLVELQPKSSRVSP